MYVYNVVFYETRNDERFSLCVVICPREREKEQICVLWAKEIIFFESEKED